MLNQLHIIMNVITDQPNYTKQGLTSLASHLNHVTQKLLTMNVCNRLTRCLSFTYLQTCLTQLYTTTNQEKD